MHTPATIVWDATTITAIATALTALTALIRALRADTKADMNTKSLDRQASHLISHDEQITGLAQSMPPPAQTPAAPTEKIGGSVRT